MTKIEWTDTVWNVVTGCTKIASGCKHCYAARMANRLRGRCGYPADDPFRVTLHPDRLEQPLRWRKPRMVFVCSMGDMFHNDVPDYFIAAVFGVMAATPQHTYQVLTKRPDRMRDLLSRINTDDNVWLGTSASTQKDFDANVPLLLSTPAAVRFVSLEPLLEPIDLVDMIGPYNATDDTALMGDSRNRGLDWVIVGGESGPRARPMHPQWVRAIRSQCVEAGVPFFFKQWGEYAPGRWWFDSESDLMIELENGHFFDLEDMFDEDHQQQRDEWLDKNFHEVSSSSVWCDPLTCYGGKCMVRVGKKAAGRELDGRTWDQIPEVKW